MFSVHFASHYFQTKFQKKKFNMISDEHKQEKNQMIQEIIAVLEKNQEMYYRLQKNEEQMIAMQSKIEMLTLKLESATNKIEKLKLKDKISEESFVKLTQKNCEHNDYFDKNDTANNFGEISNVLKCDTNSSNCTGLTKETETETESQSETEVEPDVHENAEDVYDVEAIIDHKFSGRKRQFLIRWKSFDESNDTWEMEKNLNCSRILEEYLQSNGLKQKKVNKK